MKRKKKKKKLNKQQRHVYSMSQRTRLNDAKPWLEEYVEQRLVHAYRSRYGVELLEAISELRMLGMTISEEYEETLKQTKLSEKNQKNAHNKKSKKKKAWEEELEAYADEDSDDHFAFIAGYTSGGFAYGITHEEMREIDRAEAEATHLLISFDEEGNRTPPLL